MTTSANWRRPPVGIVRVERSLCVEFEKLYGERFRCCIWRDGTFLEWSLQSIAPQIAPLSATAEESELQAVPANLPMMFSLLPRRHAAAAVAQGLLSLMPANLRPFLNRILHGLRPRVEQFLRLPRVSRWLARTDQPVATAVVPPSRKRPALFSPGDVLISVGLDWGYDFYKAFYFLRKEHQVRVVTCCYDLIPVIYPQYCVGEVAGIFTSYFLDIADGSDLVLCISKQTEKDLLAMLDRTGGAKPKTHVFPLGDNVPVASAEEISPAIREICKEPFILFVSTIERRKNHEVLYRAYHLLCEEGKRDQLPKLLFVGMQGWGVGDLLKDIELDPLTRELIVRLNHVTDAELRALYDAAKFCAFPSLYEGWGLPVGEALSLGKAILSSNRGSLPEVGGDLVRYVDPWSPRAWADEMYRMATDDAWRSEWEGKAKLQYVSRTWTDGALSVKDAIDPFLK